MPERVQGFSETLNAFNTWQGACGQKSASSLFMRFFGVDKNRRKAKHSEGVEDCFTWSIKLW